MLRRLSAIRNDCRRCRPGALTVPLGSVTTTQTKSCKYLIICYINLHRETKNRTAPSPTLDSSCLAHNFLVAKHLSPGTVLTLHVIEDKTMIVLITLFVIAWTAAATLGTMAYFLGEQTKPIHGRNWRSKSFEALAQSITNKPTNFNTRVPGFDVDAYTSSQLPTA